MAIKSHKLLLPLSHQTIDMITIKDLHVTLENKEIIRGLNLHMEPGETHILMGPNGSGKSTLTYVMMGHKDYKVTQGDILFQGKSILDKSTDERARLGIFLSFQYPTAITGVSVLNLMRGILKNRDPDSFSLKQFRNEFKDAIGKLKIDPSFAKRYINDGFSGGEKKRHEMLQMMLLQPQVAILDEIDSGLDVDSLKFIAQNIEAMKDGNRSFLIITHYTRLLNLLQVDKVHIFSEGKIVTTGDRELAVTLEKKGYEPFIK